MVSVMALWAPILLAAVLVFVVSSIVHMVLPYHRSDYRQLPSEDQVLEALRRFNIPPGDYMMPKPASMAEMKTPAFEEKYKKGPVAMLTVMPPGPFNMGRNLIQWFLFSVVVGIFAAYVSGRALGPGAPYLHVFRFAGTTAFLGYSLATINNSIWGGRSWSTTLKQVFDGLLYGLVTAGCFGWLWPR